MKTNSIVRINRIIEYLREGECAAKLFRDSEILNLLSWHYEHSCAFRERNQIMRFQKPRNNRPRGPERNCTVTTMLSSLTDLKCKRVVEDGCRFLCSAEI